MESSRIKKYDEFRMGFNVKKYLNHIAVKGLHKTWRFGKPKEFELHIYYTPIKEKIVHMKIYSDLLTVENLDLPFDIGDSFSKADEWIKKGGYEIVWDIKKF